MCGISGIINKLGSEISEKSIKEITDIIEHRGPDSYGYYFKNNIAFGHRRLSIIDLSELGHQPMNWKEKYTITYNGEIYNFIELKNELINFGFTFKSNTDTEVILAAYEKWGQNCISKFNGMWSFCIHDKINNILFCSRDRFGIKPFYYTETEKEFIFGSEIKQLILNKSKNSVNKNILETYIFTGLEEYNNETFFKNVFKLLGGHNLIYNLKNNTIKIKKYYELEENEKINNLNYEDSKNLIREKLNESIKYRLRSDVKVGSCLSGGLDSSTICSIASKLKLNDESLTAIHSKSEELKTDESEFAELVSKESNLDLIIIEPTYNDFKENINKVIITQEEPFGSPSIFMQYFVLKKARELNCIVMLDGQAGDETFLGYEQYYASIISSQSGLKKINSIIQASKNSKLNILTIMKYLIFFNNYKFRLMNIKKRNNFIKKNIIKKFESHELKSLSKDYKNIFKLQKHEILQTHVPHLLKYEDRNSMKHSIETRLPFMDYNLVEHAVNIKSNFKINSGWTKYILRDIANETLSSKIAWRKNKFGFNAPEDLWLKKHKTIMLNSILNSKILLEYINLKKFNFDLLDNRTKWRLYNVSIWENNFNVELD